MKRKGASAEQKGAWEAQWIEAAEASSGMGLSSTASHPSRVIVVQIRRVFSQNEFPHFPVLPPMPLYPRSTQKKKG